MVLVFKNILPTLLGQQRHQKQNLWERRLKMLSNVQGGSLTNICSALQQANRGRARYSFSVGHVNIVKNILG